MKKCEVCGRESKKIIKGMCQKHYNQYRKYGKVLDSNPRTRFDLNEIIIHDDYAEIILYNRNCEETARALIDLDDVNKIKNYKWCLDHYSYVCSQSCSRMHRLIMDCPEDMVIDHINHNPLDNRKSNLRICTQHENMMNNSKRNDNTSGVIGVSFNRRRNKWVAQIMYNKKHIHLGCFNTKEEAAEARRQAEIKYFGEYRNKDEDVI